MRGWDRLRLRLRSLLRRERVESELRAELDFHLEQQTAELVAKGIDPQRAREAALRVMGDVGRFAEECRDARGTRGLETLLQDLRYGLRGMLARPLFTLLATLSLAIGIGANTAIFSLIDALLLQKVPVRAPDELVLVGEPSRTNSWSDGTIRPDLISVPMYHQLEGLRSFRGLLASGRTGRIVVGEPAAAKPEHAIGRLVSGNYFEVLGVPAQRGRTFTAADDRLGAAPVVVLSDDYWRRRFDAAPDVLGQSLRLNGRDFTVVGVAPAGFLGEVVGVSTDLWVPLAMQPQLNPGRDYLQRWNVSWLLLLGRRAPGVTYEQAAREISARFDAVVHSRADGAIDPIYIDDAAHRKPLVVSPGASGVSSLRARFGQPLRALMAIVAVVLLLACVNIASLLLERAAARGKEITVRLALGAGRRRLVRQLLTESVMLAGLGGAIGIAVAFWAQRGLLALVGLRPSAALDARPSLRVLAFTAAVSLVTGVLFGLAPALRATRVELASRLRERSRAGARTAPGGRWSAGRTLVVAQFALSLLLLTGAGLFVRTLMNLQRRDLGYRPAGLLMLQLDPVGAGYRPADFGTFVERVLARLGEVPGVEAVTVSENGLFSGTDSGTTIAVVGRPAPVGDEGDVAYDNVGPGYFDVVGIPILRGRGIGVDDRAGTPRVAVINQAMARALFPHVDPIGQRFSEVRHPEKTFEVVGIAGDVHDHDLRKPVEPRYYQAMLQEKPEDLTNFAFELRTRQPRAAMEPVRAAVRSLDPRLSTDNLEPLADSIADTLRYDALVAKLSTVFGLLALVLAAIGLYGVVSHAVARRTNEIGIRMVLGADQRGVLWMVLREPLLLALVGSACGIPAALLGARLVSARLFGVSAHDLPTLLVATLVLAIVALLAGAVPGARASRLQPNQALRED